MLDDAGGIFESREDEIELDMLYVGQTHTISVNLPLLIQNESSKINKELIMAAFEKSYKVQFGRLLERLGVKIMNLRVAVIGKRPRFDLSLLAPAKDAKLENAVKEKRKIFINKDWIEVTVFNRLELPIGASVPGPAILEQPDTTIFLEEDMVGVVDSFGNFRIAMK